MIPQVTRLQRTLDASFNSHQHILLSGRPVSHGQFLLLHNVLHLKQLDLMEKEKKQRGKKGKMSKVWEHFKEKKRENTAQCVHCKSPLA